MRPRIQVRCAALLALRAGRNEGFDLAKEIGKGRLISEEDMICAIEVHEARPGDSSGQRLALLEWNCSIMPGVQDQGRNVDLPQACRNIEISKCIVKSSGVTWRCGLLLKVVEPSHLLPARARDERFGEQLAERWIVFSPTF